MPTLMSVALTPFPRMTMSRFVMCVLPLLLATHAVAADPPAPRLVNDKPNEYVGQTLTFDRVELSGDTQRLPGRYGFTVKAGKMEFKPVPDGDQKIRFATPSQSEAVRSALQMFKPGSTHLARLTVQVEKLDRTDYVATIRRIDIIRFEDEGDEEGKEKVLVTVEDVAKDHKAFVGKWVVFDRVSLTKEVAKGPARMQIGVKTPDGTEFSPPAAEGGKGFRFSLPGKGLPVKTYLETRWKGDIDQPVRLVCRIAEPNGIVAVIYRIERVLEFPIEEKATDK
jgi:hypothetical protein